MFGCPNCEEIENTMVGSGEFDSIFKCGKCGFHSERMKGPFEIIMDPEDTEEDISFYMVSVESIPEEVN